MITEHEGSIGALSVFIDELREPTVDVVNLHGQAVHVISDGTFRNVLVISSIVIFRILGSGVDKFYTISLTCDGISEKR